MIICGSQNEARLEAIDSIAQDPTVKTVTIFYREDIGKWCCEFDFFPIGDIDLETGELLYDKK